MAQPLPPLGHPDMRIADDLHRAGMEARGVTIWLYGIAAMRARCGRNSTRMRRTACVVLLAIVPWLLSWSAGPALAHPPTRLSPAAEQATAEEVVAFRKSLTDAIDRKDAAALRKLYADGFSHVHGSGKLDGKDARIVSVLAGDPVIETAPVDDLQIRVPGGWTAIATGKSSIRSLTDGQTHDFRWTAVYVRTDESWVLAASQATRLGKAK